MSRTASTTTCQHPRRQGGGLFVLLVLRVVLGAMFIVSGLMKLGIVDLKFIHDSLQVMEPRDFAPSVNKFVPGLPSSVVSILAYSIPWAELISGVCLVLGLAARSAALIIAVMMAGFIAGIVSVLVRGVDVNCSCFGNLKLLCSGPMGVCHIVRNTAFLIVAAVIAARGPGALALSRRGCCPA